MVLKIKIVIISVSDLDARNFQELLPDIPFGIAIIIENIIRMIRF